MTPESPRVATPADADNSAVGGMRVLVCGGRKFRNQDIVFLTLDRIHQGRGINLVMQGGADGADLLARNWCKSRKVGAVTFPADWERYGRSAGPRRNQDMIDLGKPDLIVAFPGNRGTADMVARGRKAGVTIQHVINAPEGEQIDGVGFVAKSLNNCGER